MSTTPAVEHDPVVEEGFVIPPEEEEEMAAIFAEADADEAAGRVISWEKFLAERASRRAG
jgi:hypothetical protein